MSNETAPSAERVARRALALSAVMCRAFIEDNATEAWARDLWIGLPIWLRESGVWDEMERAEQLFAATDLGALDRQARIDATWRSEGLAVLAWALGRYDLPAPDAQSDPKVAADALGFLGDDARATIASAKLRNSNEINDMAAALRATTPATPELRSILHERRLAIAWLNGGSAVYSQTPVDPIT